VIIVYRGFDWAGLMTARRARDAALLLSGEYSLEVSVYDIPIPLADDEAHATGLPEVVVEYGGQRRIVAAGRPPGIDELVDAVFGLMEAEYGSVVPIALGDDEAEEGLLSV